jgi:O-antigen/teichoic acid export membrane protein
VNPTRRSLWLSLADSYLMLALQVVSTMIIARVLTPAEIGVFAIAAVFSSLASMFRDFGIGEYMIQERELSSAKISAALALNILVSWAMALAMFVAAPWVAGFYANEGVAHVMRVQAIGFLFVPFGAVTMAWFRREMNMRPVMICNVAGNVTGFVVAVSMALLGVGYMSLAWSAVAAIVVTVTLSVWFRPASFPRWPSLKAFDEVFHFSKFASLMYIVAQMGKGAPEMIIGRAGGVVEVAMFSRGNGMVEMFNRLVMRSVMTICMPYFAKSDREDGSISAAYVRSVSYLTAVGWPFLAFLGIAAFAAIRIIYGPRWDDAVPLAQVLCAACAIELVHVMSREALLARGLAKDANTLQMLLVVLQVFGVCMVLPFGLMGAVWGVAGAAAMGVLVSQWFLARGIGLRTADLVRACTPSALACLLAAAPAALWALLEGVGLHNYLAFGFGGGLLTAVTWLLAIHVLHHPIVEELAPIKRRLARWVRPAA